MVKKNQTNGKSFTSKPRSTIWPRLLIEIKMRSKLLKRNTSTHSSQLFLGTLELEKRCLNSRSRKLWKRQLSLSFRKRLPLLRRKRELNLKNQIPLVLRSQLSQLSRKGQISWKWTSHWESKSTESSFTPTPKQSKLQKTSQRSTNWASNCRRFFAPS